MDLREIVPGLHLLPLGISNAYLWRDAAGTTLIDSGPPGSGRTIRAALEHLGIPASELHRIVLTHSHDDHAGSAADVARWSGARIVAGAGDAEVLRGERPAPVPVLTPAEQRLHAVVAADLQPAPSCSVDDEVVDGDVLDLATEVVVRSVPGHTPGSIALHWPELGVVLTGDIAAEHESAVVLGPFNTDRDAAWQSLRRLAALDADVAGFGHGRPVIGSAAAMLRRATDPFA